MTIQELADALLALKPHVDALSDDEHEELMKLLMERGK